MPKLRLSVSAMCPVVCLLLSLLTAGSPASAGEPAGAPAEGRAPSALLDALSTELGRSLANLAAAKEAPLYYLQYAVTEQREFDISVVNGGLNAPDSSQRRYLDVDLRVGDMALDNTHEIRGGDWRDNYAATRLVDFPLDADPAAIRAALWNETEYQYQQAQQRLTKVQANRQVKVEEQDLSNDFSTGSAQVYTEPVVPSPVDVRRWSDVLKRVGAYLAGFDFVNSSRAGLSVEDRATYMVNSEGSRLQHANHYLRVSLSVSGMADDGMELSRHESHNAAALDKLPDEAALMADAARLVEELRALLAAPVVEPYIGPAILVNRASGVFFHEIFGHRIEGHRQKSESEGQTFTKKVGQAILPDFISVYDDPTLAEFRGIDLRGHYRYDDEGTPAQRVTVVERGVLRNFLTSRSPIDNFPASNGHARREVGNDVVSRQGNLIIASEKRVGFPQLREMLIAECRRQGKPYGLIFEDISGGFTMTGRGGPQAFKVLPLLVRRVYADGRPDEVVRGVDIVGTPLTSFSKILMAADDDDVFNGTCGAESGWCPVAGISPSILVSEIEVEKRQKGQEKPPILPPSPAAAPGDAGLRAREEPAADPVFRAMQDEMARSMSDLRIARMAPPYFLAYRVLDIEEVAVEARYGALVDTGHERRRQFHIDCRVGDPACDNSNYIGSWRDVHGRREGLVEEDDYAALRRQIWLATDAAYKNALENLSRKQAHIQSHPEKEPIPDFSPAAPCVLVAPPVSLAIDQEVWETHVRAAAAALREMPGLQDWKVAYHASAENRRYLNSEGSRHLAGARYGVLEAAATTQAPDGQRLTNFVRFVARDDDAPPAGAELVGAVRRMAEELRAMAAAPMLEEYAGPVLFDDFAAAQFISQLFAAQLSPARVPLTGLDWIRSELPDPKLTGRINRRIFPEFISIKDDPLRTSWEGRALAGSRVVDDEGVVCESIALVSAGRLVSLPLGRQPTKKQPMSNGHAYTLDNRWTAPAVTNLLVETSQPEKDLIGELRRLCRDFGTEYGLLVARLEDPALSGEYRWTEAEDDGPGLLASPVVMYKVYERDGRMEPVRGLIFDEVSIRTLRDVAALGARAEAHNLEQPFAGGELSYPASIVTPDILIEEMELKAGAVHEPRPLSASPLAAQ